MSNIVVGFDLHCWPHRRHGGARNNGINRRGELCLGTTRRLVDFANEHDAHLVVAGDLVDDPGPVQPRGHFMNGIQNSRPVLAHRCGLHTDPTEVSLYSST